MVDKFSEPRDASISKEDMLQDAYLGLWKSCLDFDDTKGYQFSTYAVPMIRGEVLRRLRDSGALHIPRYFKDMRNALATHGFTLPLTDEEVDILVSEGKFSRKQIMEYSEPEIIEIDRPIKDGDSTFREIIPDSKRFESEFSEDEIEFIIDKIISYIKPNHRDMVEEWMYATLEGCGVNQSTLGIKYGMSQAAVSRVLKSSIAIVKMHGEEIRSLFGI